MKPLCATVIFVAACCVLTPLGSLLWWKLVSRMALFLWAVWLQRKLLATENKQP